MMLNDRQPTSPLPPPATLSRRSRAARRRTATAPSAQSIIQNLTFKILFILQILSSCLKFTQNPKFIIQNFSSFLLHPSNKCAQIAKEWLDKGLAKCHEIAVLNPSSRNPPPWIGKIHGISFFTPTGTP